MKKQYVETSFSWHKSTKKYTLQRVLISFFYADNFVLEIIFYIKQNPAMSRLLKSLSIIAFLLSNHAFSQSIDTVIGSYTGANATGYLQPLADVLTSSFNTGSVHKVGIDKGFHFYFGIIATNNFIVGDNLKVFTAQTPDNFLPSQTASVSTILGPASITTVAGTNGTSYSFPAGAGASRITLAVPQLTIGSVFGTEISLRFFAYNFGGDFGKLTFKGAGIRHDIGQHFLKKSDLKLSAEVYYQELETGKYSTLKTFKVGVYAGKQGKIFNYFGYLGYQQGKLDINYQYSVDSKNYSYSFTNKNPIVFGVGGGVKLGVLNIHTQANFINPISVAVGVGLNF
jgi:hypothetical protein